MESKRRERGRTLPFRSRKKTADAMVEGGGRVSRQVRSEAKGQVMSVVCIVLDPQHRHIHAGLIKIPPESLDGECKRMPAVFHNPLYQP